MKIRDILKIEEPHISFEVFPPKTDAGYDSVLAATEKIAALKPSFISVLTAPAAAPARTRSVSRRILRKILA